MLERIERHWVWPHLVTLFVICVLIDLVALGFGIVWSILEIHGEDEMPRALSLPTDVSRADALVRIGDDSVLYHFINALADSDPVVRQKAQWFGLQKGSDTESKPRLGFAGQSASVK